MYDDILNLPALIEWLETKDPDEHYNYMNGRNCLLAQFLKAKSFKDVKVFPHYFHHSKEKMVQFPGFVEKEDGGNPLDVVALCAEPRTFGGALNYARNFPYEIT